MSIYYMRCIVCKEEATGIEHNYYDFFMGMFSTFGWKLVQDKDGNLKPVCDKCSEYVYSLEDQEGESHD